MHEPDTILEVWFAWQSPQAASTANNMLDGPRRKEGLRLIDVMQRQVSIAWVPGTHLVGNVDFSSETSERWGGRVQPISSSD